MLRLLPIALSALTMMLPAHAQEKTPWQTTFPGLEGIAARCIITTDRKYARDICDGVIESMTQSVKAHNIPFDFTGAVIRLHQKSRKAAEDHGQIPPLQSSKLAKPLLMDLLIKGTSNRTASASIRVTVYLDYKQAVEKGDGAAIPRKGKLVMWRADLTGSGPQRGLAASMAKMMAGNITECLADNSNHGGSKP